MLGVMTQAPLAVGPLLLVAVLAAGVLARRWLVRRWLRSIITFSLLVPLLAALTLTGWGIWLASGSRASVAELLASSVSYEKLPVGDKGVGHLVTMDLGDPCLRLITTDIGPEGFVGGLRTETWAEEQGALVAMNASYFTPFRQFDGWSVRPPWPGPSYPEEGDEVQVVGRAVVDGELRGRPRDWQGNWDGHMVYVTASGEIGLGFDYPDDAVWGVSGREPILDDGVVTANPSAPYARSIVAFDDTRMWFLVVDGKQAGYSRGASLDTAAALLRDRGATHALELDGGGSATLATRHGVISRPIHQHIPGRSRVVANHVGVVYDCDASGNPSSS